MQVDLFTFERREERQAGIGVRWAENRDDALSVKDAIHKNDTKRPQGHPGRIYESADVLL